MSFTEQASTADGCELLKPCRTWKLNRACSCTARLPNALSATPKSGGAIRLDIPADGLWVLEMPKK
jgi:hypothetical protein